MQIKTILIFHLTPVKVVIPEEKVKKQKKRQNEKEYVTFISSRSLLGRRKLRGTLPSE
jgi:hypothetical protein